MKHLSSLALRRRHHVAFVIVFIFSSLAARAQCVNYISFYPQSGAICSPQTVTMRAEFENYNSEYVYGQFLLYNSDTDPWPIDQMEVNSNEYYISTNFYVYANNNATYWVSFYNWNTGCESERFPYTFTFSQMPYLNQDYASNCWDGTTKIQLSSNVQGVEFWLYRLYDLNDPGSHQLVEINSTGYFVIDYFNDWDGDRDRYYAQVRQPWGCQNYYYYKIEFEVTQQTPPTVSGNLSVTAGSSTAIYVNGNAYNYQWFDGSGNFMQEAWGYATPTTLPAGSHNFMVRGVSSSGTCFTDPTWFTVNVNYPTTSYSSLYNSSNFTKTIDLSKPVGAVNGAAATSSTGAATYTFPIYTPPGTNGLQPAVGISYSSQGGNGIAGYGWSVSGLSVIGRTGKDMYHDETVRPVAYTSEDAFTLDGMRLNPISGGNGGNGTIYAGEAENFSKIISMGGSANNPEWFQVTAKDGSILEFGHSADSRVLTDDGANVINWRLSRMIDIHGNYIEFKYDNAFRDSRILEINYTGNTNTSQLPYNSIKFNYEVRNDIGTIYTAGASLVSKHILKSISILNDGTVFKTYTLDYGFDNLYSLLKEVTETGSDGSTLNSTIFLYGDAPANLSVENSWVVAGQSVDIQTGDYNGDGISDIMAATYGYSNGVKYNTDYTVYSRTDQNSAFQPQYNVPLNTTWQVIYSKQVPSGKSFISSDFDGDGRDDILLIQNHIQNVHDGSVRIDGIQINYSRSQPVNYQTAGFPLPTIFDIWGNAICSLTSPPYNFIIPGDFDGDGASDYITILRNDVGQYACHLTSPRTGAHNLQINPTGVSAASAASANDIQPIDFDGDGKMELLVTIGATSYVLSITYAFDLWTAYRWDVIYQTNSVNNNTRIFPGDFNADRKTDLLVRSSISNWYILYSTGKTFITQSFTFNRTVDINNQKIVVADFNGDGKADIMHGWDYFVGGSASTAKLDVYYSKGNPASGFSHEQSDYGTVLGFTPLVVADLNGDGRNDFINRNYYGSPFDILYLKKNGKERLMAKVMDGHKNTTTFNYRTMTDKTATPYVYNRTVAMENGPNQYPFNYVQQPIYVVSSMASPNGIGNGINTITYNYENAVVHRGAKGFLGFKKIVTRDATKGIYTETENEINTSFGVPYMTKQTGFLTSGEMLSESTITTSFISLGAGGADLKRFVTHVDKVLNANHLTGSGTETTNTYDNYGNVINSVVKTGALSGSTVNEIETVNTTTNFGTYNTPVPARPDNMTVVRSRTGMPGRSSTTSFTYHGNGALASRTMFSGLPKAVTETYAYNSFGNVTQVTTAASGLNSRTGSSGYDSKGRFALTKQTGSASVSRTESFTYDSRWGHVLSHTTTDCLTSTFEYDGFGKLKKTTLPDNNTILTSLNWDIQGDNIFYEYTNISGGAPGTKVWHDKLGRVTTRQTAGFGNQWLSQGITYNAKGEVFTQTNNYYPGETPLITTNTYDDYGRLQTVVNNLNTTDYTYTKLSGGSLQTTIYQASGQTSSTITDATGKTISATNAGGQVDFAYNSVGQQVQVTLGGIMVQTADYDVYGRQTSLTDKNAGTSTYDYDALGQLKQQTDNNGNTSNMTYDDFGRMITRQGPEGTTTYEYWKDNGTGCSNDNISKITGFNGIIKENIFDNNRRLQIEKITVDGVTYSTQFGYNSFGNLVSTTYPSGIVITNNYNSNGQLTSVTGGNPGAPVTLFTGTQMNGAGKYTQYTLGNNRSGQNTYNYGIPTRFYTSGIQDLNLNFNYTTGNLSSRQDLIKNITESFQYDDLNRLTQTTVNGQTQINIGYDITSGNSLGNIVSKTDAGNYVYKNDKINAVAYITNPAGAQNPPVTIATTDQILTYTPFLKTATITEGNYQANFTYDMNLEKVKSTLAQSGSTIETKYFLGNYEKQITTSGTREIHYVSGGNGLCTIIVKENGATSFYVVYTDHLGSLLTVTDLNGNVVAEQNFDAWGRQRNPATWQYGAVAAAPAWLYRGYTGHEYLPQFALVNMNGRMYDPIQARMLSPDMYVAFPMNTQGYNRYAYAMNNPLVNTDPDGEFVHLIVGAVIGGLMNLMMADMNGQIGSFWDGLKYFGVGAAAGALGAGVGSGVSASLAGSTFGAGFMGATGATGAGFISGFAAGAAGGFSSGFIAGFGNKLVDGGNIGSSLNNGLTEGLTGAITGGIMGGISGGIRATKVKTDFWTGKTHVDLSKGVGAHGVKADQLKTNALIKYVGRFEKIAVYESASLGAGEASGGLTLPNMGIIVGTGVYAQTSPLNWDLLAHEFGHVLQSKLPYVGFDGYYAIIAPESAASAAFDDFQTSINFWTETWANYLSSNYFSNHAWNNSYNPVKNISFWNMLKFMTYRVRQPLPLPAIYP
jgi:RHS repeat-associated protein